MKHSRHEGELLAEYIKLNNISRNEFCETIEISHQILAYHLKRPLLSNKFKQRLVEAGVDLFEDRVRLDTFLLDQNKELQERIEMLTRVIELQKQFITHVTAHCKNGVCLNFVLKKEIAN
jgi:hypothetical protein